MNEQQEREIQRNFEEIRGILGRKKSTREEISTMIEELISGLELDLVDPCRASSDNANSEYILNDENLENTSSDFDASEVLRFTEDLKSFIADESNLINTSSEKVLSEFPDYECRCAATPDCEPNRRINSFVESFAELLAS